MATGRGQFLLSLRQGLERTQAGRHGGNSGGSGKNNPARDGRSSRRCRDESCKPPPPPPQAVCCPTQSWSLPASFCRENYFKRMPPEIILKIFSYLDAASLFCVGFVNRQFHELANDNVIWYELYSCEMGRRKWRPRLCETPDSASADVQDVPAAVWKKLLFSEMGCHKDAVWKKELRHVNLNTGMPEQTEQVLRSLRVVWEITLTHKGGKQSVYEQSQAFFTDSSVTVCWSAGVWPQIHHVFSVQLHGVLGSPTTVPAKPQWRSLISKTVLSRNEKWRWIGTDRLVKLMQFDEVFTVGVWRGTWIIAFIMATLHFHRLVERSVLGSLFWYAANCCVMTLSVLDEAQRPVWCISSSAALILHHSHVVSESYGGEQFALRYDDTAGKLKMTLVWMQDLQLYFLISLHIWIRVEKVNTRFHKAVQDKF
ncbi:hypothetical protein PDJAM_G00058870 [Pangasius djambal]|uniref:Uncharacterized protein n=1 Tax=Pangasius djambal TaxID=1691987 RepID=A0ACC5YYM7_9TELE|nr:hypothetical protein [Pangasius djambal]